MEEENSDNGEFTFQKVGEQLKAERERRGLTLDDIAGTTRVPIRHLQAIDASEYDKLPGSTYCIGFTRSYAGALEMDQAKIANELREELAENGMGGFQTPTPSYEPANPSSVPSRMLAWTAATIGILIIGGFLVWRGYFMDGGLPQNVDTAETQIAETTADDAEKQAVPANAAPKPDGQVVLTAKGPVWLKIYNDDRKRLYETEMKAGDKYLVPKDANNPMILTGRPEMLAVTIDGKAMPPLGEAERTISNLGISASALIERAVSADTDAASAVESGTTAE